MTYENYIKAKLADVAVEDGYRYGGTDCAMAVAQVMFHRVEAGWHGGDWRKVIAEAPNVRGTTYTKPYDFDTREPSFRQILASIDDVYHGLADASGVMGIRDGVDVKALYYCVLHNVTSEWFKDHVLADRKSHPNIAVVGQLTFFA
jgi:hypothetical protein